MDSKRQSGKMDFLGSLSQRVITLIMLVITLLVVQLILSYQSNNETINISEELREQNQYIELEISTIKKEIGNVSALYSAFLLTNDFKINNRRKNQWNSEILPSMNRLRELVRNDDLEIRREVDTLDILLDDYKDFQETRNQDNAGMGGMDMEFDLMSNNDRISTYINHHEKIMATVKVLEQYYRDYQIGLTQAISESMTDARGTLLLITVLTIVILLILAILVISAENRVQRPVHFFKEMSLGVLPELLLLEGDEFDPLIEAGNKLRNNLYNASRFAIEIGQNKYTSIFHPLGPQDILGNALIDMRDKLSEYTLMEEKRTWSSKGIGVFADILRSDENGLEDLADNIISTLVRYLNANQGGFFTLDEHAGKKVFMLQASYAYDKKKYIERTIELNEEYADNLLNQVYLEKKTIYLTKVPDGYVYVTSGLGEATPSYLILVPLHQKEDVVGVLEVASFKPFESYQIEFVERIAENIASAYLAAKSADMTKALLQASQLQTEQLKAQEEEMRQNMEELTATQEEMDRKQKELQSLKGRLEVEVESKTRSLNNTLERYELAQQSSSEGLWDTTAPSTGLVTENTKFWYSDQLRDLLGYTKKDLGSKFKDILFLIHPDDRVWVEEQFLIRGFTPDMKMDRKVRVKVKSGEFIHFNFTINTKAKKNGTLRLAGTLANVQAEHEVRANQALLTRRDLQFSQLSQNLDEILFQLRYDIRNDQYQYTYLSERFQQYFTMNPEDSYFTFAKIESGPIRPHPEESELFAKNLTRSSKSLKPMTWNGRMINSDVNEKRYHKVTFKAIPVKEDDNSVVWNGIISVIDEAQNLNQALDSLDLMAVRYWMDGSRLIVNASAGCSELLAMPVDKFMKEQFSLIEFLPLANRKADNNSITREIKEQLDKKGHFSTVYRIVDKAGTPKIVLEKGMGIKNLKGHYTQVQSFITDLTPIRPN